MRPNTLKTTLARGGRVVNGWLSSGDPLLAETMAHAGFDALTIDLQHGAADASGLLELLQAISATPTVPIIRVPWNDPAIVMRALDLGAYGVICPMINSRVDAEVFVRSCRYPPEGIRSFGPTRGLLYGGSDYAEGANAEVLAVAMIETLGALTALDEILSVPGLDAVFVGPADLSQSLGGRAGSDWDDGPVPGALERILESSRAHGIPAGIFTKSVRYAKHAFGLGFQLVTVASDVAYVAQGAAQVLTELRGAHSSA